MKKSFGLSVCAVVVGALSLGAATMHNIILHGAIMSSPLRFSPPRKIGVDAVMAAYPHDAKLGNERFSVIAVLYTPEARKRMKMNDADLLNYTKTVFLGYAKPGRPISREFGGKAVGGEAFDKKIPAASSNEVYLITLKNGNAMGVGFSFQPAMKRPTGPQLIEDLAASLRE